eukprot:s2403_g7.t3
MSLDRTVVDSGEFETENCRFWALEVMHECAQVTCGVTAPKQSTTGEEAKVPQAALRSLPNHKSLVALQDLPSVRGVKAVTALVVKAWHSQHWAGSGGALGRRWHRGNLCGRKMTKFQAWSCRYSRKRRKPKPSC